MRQGHSKSNLATEDRKKLVNNYTWTERMDGDNSIWAFITFTLKGKISFARNFSMDRKKKKRNHLDQQGEIFFTGILFLWVKTGQRGLMIVSKQQARETKEMSAPKTCSREHQQKTKRAKCDEVGGHSAFKVRNQLVVSLFYSTGGTLLVVKSWKNVRVADLSNKCNPIFSSIRKVLVFYILFGDCISRRFLKR